MIINLDQVDLVSNAIGETQY